MSGIGWSVLAICFLAGGTLFFSVCAIALRTFSRVELHEALKATGKEAESHELVETLARDAERLILACSLYRLIFNACILLLLVHILASAEGTAGPGASDYVLALVAAMGIFSVFGLSIPHAWAKYAGEKVLSRTHRLLAAFAVATEPVLWFLRLNDAVVRRLAGVADTTPEERLEEKQEEFLTDLQQHRMEGAVDEEQQQMIENVLELSDTTADEIMTPRTDIVAVDADASLAEVLETITSAGHTRVPVYEGNIDNITGMVYAKDLLGEIGKDPAQFKLREKMRDAYFVPETKPLRALLHEFQNQKLHIAVVLDEYGGTAGIVTLEDILEELVGEITDEYEQAPAEQIKQIDKDTVELDARTYVDDLNDRFGFNLPEDEDYDTVGGFVFSRLGYIPKKNETFVHENLRFTVIAAEPRRIKRIRIERISGQ